MEKELAEIWKQVLDLPHVDADADFFDLGGHSLLATRVVSRVRSRLSLDLPLQSFFNHSVLSQTAALLEDLQPDDISELLPSARPAGEHSAPLSYAQQRLWFIDRMQVDAQAAAYNMLFPLVLEGELSVAGLEWSLEAMIERHEILRTRFAEQGGEPYQLIDPAGPVSLAVLDLRHYDEETATGLVKALAVNEMDRSFDLNRGPLIRFVLARMDEGRHALLLTIHHIIFDGWSIGVFMRELREFYRAKVFGETPALAAPQRQYADFSGWQRRQLSGDRLAEKLDYWTTTLAGAPPLLDLPLDRRRPSVLTNHGDRVTFQIDPTLVQTLTETARRHKATLFMITEAAFAVLMGRYALDDDILLGSPVANRNHEHTESMLGFFVNTLVMRNDLSGDPNFDRFLERVRDTAVGAFTNQDVPFELIVEALQPERNLSHAPIFQVMFALQTSPMSNLSLPGFTIEGLETGRRIARFELTLELTPLDDGGLFGTLEFNTDLFEIETAQRLVAQYGTFLHAVADDTNRPLSALPLEDEESRRQMLQVFGDTKTPAPLDEGVHRLFEAIASERPHETAVVYPDGTLTYAELNGRANFLARRLLDAGVDFDEPVGIFLEPSYLVPTAMQAVLKAGALYVPLDPHGPSHRLEHMIEDSGIRVVITTGDKKLPIDGLTLIDAALEGSAENPDRPVLPHQAAYMMFTSGSTGKPKGAVITHAGIIRLVRNADYLPFGRKTRITQAAAVVFDAATLEIWGALLNGGCLVRLPGETALSAGKLAAFLKTNQIETLVFTTALFNQLVAEDPRVFNGLENMIFGGEAADPARVRQLVAAGGPNRLINAYGPTEATAISTWHLVDTIASHAPAVPIGGPITNTDIFITDRRLQPTPMGVPGELLIGGPGLARGYHGRPALTAERFVPHPFSDQPGERLYRSGDLVRLLPGARTKPSVAFVGRLDQQVKLRGFRIELGEIESVLVNLPVVAQTVVLVHDFEQSGKLLTAYVVPTEVMDEGRLTEILTRELKRDLPDYMIPSAFMVLEALPLTPNGKLDRRALPKPQIGAAEADYVAPLGVVEERLARIWAEVLGVEKVGRYDDFFKLGGHSLLAVRVVSRVQAIFRYELPVRSVFEHSSLADLAGIIGSHGLTVETEIIPLTAEQRAAGPVLSYAQQRLWFLDRLEGANPSYNIPQILRLRGPLSVIAAVKSFQLLGRRHEVLRTVFEDVDGLPFQRIQETFSLNPRIIDLSGSPETLPSLTTLEAEHLFDLAAGPLMRVTLFRLKPDDHVLVLNMHHIISDGWSMDLLVREFRAAYGAHLARTEPNLPELPVQYADYAAWQRQRLSGDGLEKRLNYWRHKLSDLSVLDMPTDRPRPSVQDIRGNHCTALLDASLTEAVKLLAQDRGCSLFMTLLANFYALLHRYTGQTDIAVGTPVACRSQLALENLIGLFLNTLVIRGDLSGDPSFRDLLLKVRTTMLEAFEHQELPFEKLVEELQPERDLSRNPLFQVYFNMPVMEEERLDAGGLTVEAVPTEHDSSKFDLALYAVDRGETVHLQLVYAAALFDAETMDNLLERYVQLLSAAAAKPHARLSTISMLSAAAQAALDSATSPNLPSIDHEPFEYISGADSVPARFGRVAARFAERPAVIDRNETWTYDRLHKEADHIAQALVQQGRPERVALLFPQEAGAIAAMMGVLSTGAAYVPIDPFYPEERVAFILEDADVGLILTHSEYRTQAREIAGSDVPVRTLEELQTSDTGPSVAIDPMSTAYLLYTSGSTGVPKGVVQNHFGMSRHVGNYIDNLRLGSHDRISLLPTYSFDAAVMDIYGALLSGACLCIYDLKRDGFTDLALRLDRDAVTVIHTTPTVFRHITSDLPTEFTFAHARLLVLGGEEAVRADFETWRRHFPDDGRLVNGLGPTESTVALQEFFTRDSRFRGNSLPIGFAVGGLDALLLNEAGEEVADFAEGEIVLRGAHLAAGYWRRPQLTEAAFQQDGEVRRYHTGDRARRTETGSLVFAGRKDQQLKIRGHRIEPAEIEARLTELEDVRESVVMPKPDRNGNSALVAYVVPARDRKPDTADLFRYLKAKLPAYMVPALFIPLTELPRTAHGKLDRRSLPEPDFGRLQADQADYVAPSGRRQELIAGVWCEVLEVERVGAEDNFFELGGHSLLATRVVSRIQEATGQALSLRTFFESPTVAKLADKLTGLPDESQVPVLQPISRNPEGMPLSFAQERLWFLDQLEGASAGYNMPMSVRFHGELDLSRLEEALNALVARHESLRTNFAVVSGQPVQSIRENRAVFLQVIDLSAHVIAFDELQHLAGLSAGLLFDLREGPLIRAHLFRLGERDHVVVFTMHHIISDAWSLGVMVREIVAYYSGYSNMPALPVQYADYALWQRQWLAGDELARQLSFWRDYLTGAPAFVDLPTDRPRPAVMTYNGAHLPFSLDPELTASFRRLVLDRGTTPFLGLQAAFAVLLSRTSGQDEVVIGSPIAGRVRPELEPMIGFFVNMLAMRIDLSDEPTVSDLLRQHHHSGLAAFDHQDIPFERLVEELKPERDRSRSPLFQVTLGLTNVPRKAQHLPGLTLENFPLQDGTAKFDLNVNLFEEGEAITGVWEYNTDLFDRDTMERMLNRFQMVLSRFTRQPDTTVSELDLVTEDERRLLLEDWTATASAYPEQQTIHGLFEARAAATPNAPAVVSSLEDDLSYAQLNRRANQLADCLGESGARPGDLIGVSLHRSTDMIVSILAVLKTGCAYLPLDESYPEERLSLMMTDAAMKVLITRREIAEKLPLAQPGSISLVLIDSEDLSGRSAENRNLPGHPDDLAYVNYTSGSTGKPKGVCTVHRGVTRLLFGIDYVRLDDSSVILQTAPISFDGATFEIWGALLHGGRTVLYPDRVPTPEGLAETIGTHGVNTIFMTTALFNHVMDTDPAVFTGVRELLVGGEAASARHFFQVFDCLPNLKIANIYGPTESTTFSTCYAVPGKSAPQPIPIGPTINNTVSYILDRRMQPQPVGVPGVLYLGGAGLARGYLNRPGLTAERFVPNPFGPGDRLYHTGDLVRYLPDGNIQFMGRVDHQVKIRGHRIELGEIENALNAIDGVARNITLMRQDQPGEKRLVAYLVAEDGVALSPENLKNILGEHLPDYMIPGALVILDELPLNPNGKIDRKALPKPETVTDEADFTAPRTPLETQLAEIWSEVMGLDQVSVRSNFFDLGGHSLMATRVVSRIRESLNVELPLENLFANATIESLAACLSQNRNAAVSAPAMTPVDRNDILPLSFAQQRLWFIDRLEQKNESASGIYNMRFPLRLKGVLSVAALQTGLQALIDRHEILRTRFAAREGEPYQIIDPTLSIALNLVDLEGMDETKIVQLASEEGSRPFDLEQGPLIRFTLVRFNEQNHVLLMAIHHIIFDGWSIGVFIGELSERYGALVRDNPTSLPAQTLQYADFAAWQRDWLSGDTLGQMVDYWKNALADMPPLLSLPTDYRHPPVVTYNGALHLFQIDASITGALQALARTHEASLFMVLEAAFALLLGRYAGSDDVAVGSPIANRNRAEIEPMLGFFVNTLVLRNDLSGDPSFKELLDRVSKTTLGAFAHQDVPFELVVEALQPDRDMSHTPLFQVMFALQNAPMGDLNLPGLSLGPVDTDGHTVARFELTMNLFPTEEGGLSGNLEFNTDLFSADTARRLIQHYKVLLAAVAENPERPVSALPLMDRATRQRLLKIFGDKQTPAPLDVGIPALFESVAVTYGDQPAVIYADQTLTYAQLNRRANQLAQRLITAGAGTDMPVGIFLTGSAEMVVAMLAVLKAGAAYVPLDPDYPVSRLQYMIADSGMNLVICRGDLSPPCDWVNLLDVADAMTGTDDNPDRPPFPGQAAYIMFTSGSTGKPKGTVIPHRAVIRLVRNSDYIQLGPETRTAQAANVVFDATTFEIWGPLLNGGRVYGVPKETALSAASLSAWFKEHAIDSMFITTALFNQLIAEQTDVFAPLKTLMFGGEAVDPNRVRQALAGGPPQRLLHVYGPTEVTTFSTWFHVDHVAATAATVPIGTPLANTEALVLDRNLEPAPLGVPGELFLGGPGLARGYHGRPALTAERFIPHPLTERSGERLYRTGDLVRLVPHGEKGAAISFVGRLDHQIKLRGFRIELGEIGTALVDLPLVAQTVVLMREHVTLGKLIAAYVVPAGDESHAELPALLRAELKQSLPDYMIPRAFVIMDVLPLTPNGKIDRRALPEPDMGDTGLDFIAPRGETEEQLAAIWSQVLGVERIGVHDNFFDLGGHSLLVTQVVSRIRAVFDVDLPLRTVFEHATVADLARALTEVMRVDELDMPQPVPVGRERDLPLSFAQQRLWFVDQMERRENVDAEVHASNTYNMPFPMHFKGALRTDALIAALHRIVSRHEVLRTSFIAPAGQPIQQIHAHRPPGVALTDLSGLDEQTRNRRVKQLVKDESEIPFSLASGPLLRVNLLRLAEDDHILLLTLHHIVFDGWSLGVMVDELVALYRSGAAARGTVTEGTLIDFLNPLPIQYADFSAWQRDAMDRGLLESQIEYWRKHLTDVPRLELPTDRPRPPVQTFNGGGVLMHFDAQLSGRLAELGRETGATMFMTLYAALTVLMARYSGQTDIALGSPIANRNRAEIEPLLGFFVNSLVLRLQLDDDPSFRKLLERARRVTLEAYQNQDVPFELVVDMVQPERALSHSPLFQVAFALQNAPMGELELPGLALEPIAGSSISAKFDLTFVLSESERGLSGALTFNSDLFEQETAERMVRHFGNLLEAAVAQPDQSLSELALLREDERNEILYQWNDTATDYRDHLLMFQRFEDHARTNPDAVALVFGDAAGTDRKEMTYGRLNERANQTAHLLRELGVGPEDYVGIFSDHSFEMVIGVLGILKAGGAYVPMEPTWPETRWRHILSLVKARVMIANRKRLRALMDAQWKLEDLEHLVSLDMTAPEPETVDTDAVRALFDHVAERGDDEVSRGGFVSSYTGKAFRQEEVDAYRERVVGLAEPHLDKSKTVLEIGCGSGLIMFDLVDRVSRYIGSDPSPLTQQHNHRELSRRKLDNVNLVTGFAHETESLPDRVDMVIVASTIQFFPGYFYLETVIADLLERLEPGGVILLADVMNARLKDDFRESLDDYRLQHPEAQVKESLESEFYLDEDYFHDLAARLSGLARAEVSHRTEGFENELRFRYDVILHKAKPDEKPVTQPCRKQLHTAAHLEGRPVADPVPVTKADNSAYTIFTSGSTGLPKGVPIRHAGLADYITWAARSYVRDDQLCFPFFTSPAFDLTLTSLFLPLVTGGTLIVYEESDGPIDTAALDVLA
ncbi:MAG: amino acid adenylation domain-containing protein, partial [Acidobacteriota bacterium]|nr:amino acid adenylation domain-containing protein [Acidobacteriota bacterium]